LIGASLQSPAEEIFEGFSMLLAAGILTWMIFWMQRQSRQLRHEIENQVKTSLQLGARPLFWLAFFAVFREGVELAIFLLAAGLATNPGQSLIGALAGLTVALVAGWLLFQSTRRLPIRPFFQLTNVLLLLFAAGLFAHGIHEFNEVGWIPAVIAPIYDLSPVLPEDSILGSLLKAMFGYNANPSLTETLAYLTYLLSLGFFVLGSAFRPRPVPSQAD
jgi:high-affinity iron transporter